MAAKCGFDIRRVIGDQREIRLRHRLIIRGEHAGKARRADIGQNPPPEHGFSAGEMHAGRVEKSRRVKAPFGRNGHISTSSKAPGDSYARYTYFSTGAPADATLPFGLKLRHEFD